MLSNPLFSKILMICLMALVLLIPLSMIQSKVTERQSLQHEVQRDIARSASGFQTFSGPYLVLRYKLNERRTVEDNAGNEKVVVSSAIHDAVVRPSNLRVDGNADIEIRKRGIYKARLFHLHGNVSGQFAIPQGYGLNTPLADITPVAAYFVMKVSDARGISNSPVLTIDGNQFQFAPGSIGPVAGNGIHAALKPLKTGESHTLHFDFPLDLQGMRTIKFTPSGETTEVSLQSSWPHPSFGGGYLPRSHTVNEKGFTARWLVSNLARNNEGENEVGNPVAAEIFSVSFISPVDTYLLSERAVKYGVLFIVLVFAAFFMFEILRSLRIHAMQYLLVGLALAMFFLLIISLSEHMAFFTAYVASGLVCTALIGFYLAGVLKSIRPAFAFSCGILLLYAVLYGVLQSEDNALLMGSLLLFVALASMMTLSRKMDWYSISGSQELDETKMRIE